MKLRKIVDYIIIFNSDLDKFVDDIKKFITFGYEFQGTLLIHQSEGCNSKYFQAMVKYEDVEEDLANNRREREANDKP